MDGLNEKLRELIKASGLTIYKLTVLAGLSENTINNRFNKGAEPSVDALKAICPYLNITLSELFADDKCGELTFSENELISYFRELSNENKSVIIKLARDLKEK